MFINDVNRARLLIEQRSRLRTQIEIVVEARPRSVGLTIQGYYADEAMLARVRPVLLAELSQRVTKLEAELAELGVHVEPIDARPEAPILGFTTGEKIDVAPPSSPPQGYHAVAVGCRCVHSWRSTSGVMYCCGRFSQVSADRA